MILPGDMVTSLPHSQLSKLNGDVCVLPLASRYLVIAIQDPGCYIMVVGPNVLGWVWTDNLVKL